MAGYHSFIGYPWIIDCLAKYGDETAKQKSVPAQVVEFLRMPVNSEDSPYPEAVIYISDQKYFIRAVITKEAQQMLESEDEHFTLADIKNKIIILKNFSVCFTAVEDLGRCEFYVTVRHFSILPMETNTVDILNCNMEPGVRKMIKELWQNYITELEMNETSPDMNLSDVSLTQLLMLASEEKFSSLKSIAERCLDLDPFATQDIPPEGSTIWSRERKRNQENTERFVISVDLLLIPPHEAIVLEQMTGLESEVRNVAGQCTSELADSSEGDNSSQPYCTALSTLSEESIDEGPSSQSRNPWNKLQSLCVSVVTSSDSQPKCSPSVSQKSRGNEVGSDPDSSTPDIFTSDADLPMGDFPTGNSDISPLMFSEHSSNPQQPSTSIPQPNGASSNTSPNGRQGRSLNLSIAPLNLMPLYQDSPQRHLSMGSKVQISPVKSYTSENKSNLANKTDFFSLSDESNRCICWPLRARKASKRKQTSEGLEGILADVEHQTGNVENPDCVTTTAYFGEEIDEASNNDVQTVASKQMGNREAVVPLSDMEENNQKTEQYIKRHFPQNHKSKESIQTHTPSLQFVVNPKTLPTKHSASEQLTAIGPTTSKVCIQEAPAGATHGLSSFEAKDKGIAPSIEAGKTELAHHDGTPFQYEYKPPTEEFCTCVNTIKFPAGLCEWAEKMLSEDQQKVL